MFKVTINESESTHQKYNYLNRLQAKEIVVSETCPEVSEQEDTMYYITILGI